MLQALIVFCFMWAVGPAVAADVARSKSPACDIVLRGYIEEGDVRQLDEAWKAVQAARSSLQTRLCLHSAGGSYDEGLRLIKWLKETTNIYTVIDKGDECYSACSLVFMFGNHYEGDALISSHRELHVQGKLGFHTPHISPAIDSNKREYTIKAYRSGIRAIGELLEADWDDWFPKSLLVQALKKEPDEFLVVDTVLLAAR